MTSADGEKVQLLLLGSQYRVGWSEDRPMIMRGDASLASAGEKVVLAGGFAGPLLESVENCPVTGSVFAAHEVNRA